MVRYLEDAKREIYECDCARERNYERKKHSDQLEILKDNLGQLQKNEQVDKLASEEEKLERLICRLNRDNVNVNRNEVENLRKAYKKWWQARERRVRIGEA